MRLNREGVELIRRYESLKLKAYICPAGKPTIGWGHTRTVTHDDVRNGRTITVGEAEALFEMDMDEFCPGVERLLRNATNENEFAAMVSLAFNIGLAAFSTSSVLRQHNQGRATAAANAFRLWNKARVNGVLYEMRGLVARRAAESELYLKPVIRLLQSDDGSESAGFDMPQSIEPPPPVAMTKTSLSAGAATVASALSVGAQMSNDVASVRYSLGPDWMQYVVLGAAIFGVVAGIYLIWNRWRDRQEGMK